MVTIYAALRKITAILPYGDYAFCACQAEISAKSWRICGQVAIKPSCWRRRRCRTKKRRPPGEEVRRASLVSIGGPGGEAIADLVGDVGRRRSSPDRCAPYRGMSGGAVGDGRHGKHADIAYVVPPTPQGCPRNRLALTDRAAEAGKPAALSESAMRKTMTPAGGGDPAGVTKDDWQPGGGVLPIVSERRWEEEYAAPNSVDLLAATGSCGIMPGVRPIPPCRSSCR